MKDDPYLYTNSDVLINKKDIRDAALLQKAEIEFVKARLMQGLPKGQFDYTHLKKIHRHLFQDLYTWAGQERTMRMSKGGSQFAFPEYIQKELNKLFLQLKADRLLQNLDQQSFCKKAAYYFNELNAAHPFREGNGRTNRLFFDQVAEQAGYSLAWYKTNHRDYINASIEGFQGNNEPMEKIFSAIANPLEKTLSREKDPSLSVDRTLEM